MSNGYFRLVDMENGFGLKIVPPTEGGEAVKGAEITAYLEKEHIDYDVSALKTALEATQETIVYLGPGNCPVVDEKYFLSITQDHMKVFIRFQAPSPKGKRIDAEEVLADLKLKKIVFGIRQTELSQHLRSDGIYDRFLTVAVGKPPRQGHDARIEYFFETDRTIQPTLLEDGSVDYYQLNILNHCRVGDILATIHPADFGEDGMDVFGSRLKPREVRQYSLKYGNNIQLSEDKMSISSMVDGHVRLVDDQVFVSNVYEVENVDLSSGNIDFVGSVQVNGNVNENLRIVAGGDVEIHGVVEGAFIQAGGNIIIARGINGMSKGCLKAGGNIICKYIENCTVFAEGYVNTESILYSDVAAGGEINVNGRKGFITGGHIQAGHSVTVKNLGANMGNSTIVEVGVNPIVKTRYMELSREITEIVKAIRNAQPILMNFAEKRSKGARFSQDQIKYIAELDKMIKENTILLNEKNEEARKIQEVFDSQKDAKVEVQGVVCTGTTIIIGDLSHVINKEMKYCRFVKKDGEIKVLPL